MSGCQHLDSRPAVQRWMAWPPSPSAPTVSASRRAAVGQPMVTGCCADRAGPVSSPFSPKISLDPRGQRIAHKLFVSRLGISAIEDSSLQSGSVSGVGTAISSVVRRRVSPITRSGRTSVPKSRSRPARPHGAAPRGPRPTPSSPTSRRTAGRGRASVADPAHEHRHVRSLAAPVRVQFVEHQKSHPLGSAHKCRRSSGTRAGRARASRSW